MPGARDIKHRSTHMSNTKTSQDYWVNENHNLSQQQLTFTGRNELEFTLVPKTI